MSDQNILFEAQAGIARLTLNRPDKLNSFTSAMHAELRAALATVQTDKTIRVLVISGAGRAFCAGQDLADPDMAMGPMLPDIGNVVEENYKPLILGLQNLRVPTVAMVNGIAAGAGASLALACDLVIAAKSAYFLQAFSKIGLVPDSGGTYFLPRLIGFAKASALMMLGEKVSAKDAEAMGMIYKTLPTEGFDEAALAIAKQLAQMPTKGLGYTKRLLNMSFENILSEQLEAEDKYQTLAGGTADYREGVTAFLEKRKPNFKGL